MIRFIFDRNKFMLYYISVNKGLDLYSTVDRASCFQSGGFLFKSQRGELDNEIAAPY